MSSITPGQSAKTFYCGFLSDGNLWVADGGFPPEVSAMLSRLKPAVMAALQRSDYATAVRVALQTLEVLADELRPPWADSLTQDQTLVQAVMVEVGCGPSDAQPGRHFAEPVGTAVWVIHRAWAMSRAEALSAARRLGGNSGRAVGSDSTLPPAGDGDGPAPLWTRA